MPGKDIKILRYKKKLLTNVDYIFLGAWNFKNEIFKKEKKFISEGGKFITHIPRWFNRKRNESTSFRFYGYRKRKRNHN